jgi:hypothetical protein
MWAVVREYYSRKDGRTNVEARIVYASFATAELATAHANRLRSKYDLPPMGLGYQSFVVREVARCPGT